MKTAINQLLERIESAINTDPANDIGKGHSIALKFVIHAIKSEWLEVEKQQIIDAYVQSKLSANFGANESTILKYCNEAEKYYKQMFSID